MGLFRSGFLACLVVGSATFAQQGTPPAPAPGAPDPNAPIPIPAVPEPTPTPGVDPNALQPAPATPDLSQPAAPATNAVPKAKKPAAPALPTLRGTVSTIDKNAMTITIHGKSKEETLNITSKTRIFADGKPAILADAKEGENVIAEYHTNKEKAKDALTLRFGGAGSSDNKVIKSDKEGSDTKTPAKKPTKKAAAKKKTKKAPATTNPTPLPADNTGVTPLPTPDPTIPAPNPGTPAPAPGTPGTNP